MDEINGSLQRKKHCNRDFAKAINKGKTKILTKLTTDYVKSAWTRS